jgi:hypothetical protein
MELTDKGQGTRMRFRTLAIQINATVLHHEGWLSVFVLTDNDCQATLATGFKPPLKDLATPS